jgi:hypothetical protein
MTHKYRIVEEREYGKSNKAILENVVPAYILLKIRMHSKFNVKQQHTKATNFTLSY